MRKIHARLETCYDVQIVRAAAAWFHAIQTKRSPEILFATKRKCVGQNTHYAVGLAVKLNRFRYDVRIASKLALPERITEQRVMRMAGLGLVSAKRAAKDRRNAEQREYASRGVAGGNLHRLGIRAS